jgi:hypothetical protein
MSPALDKSLLDPKTPKEVEITLEAREPMWDPKVGVPTLGPRGAGLPAPPAAPIHRLVTVGDSLTQGFQSGAIFNTDLSWPAIVAWEMGDETFSYPSYGGFGGLPINIEFVIRDLEARYGDKLNWYELAPAVFRLRHLMDEIEDWWERGGGARVPNVAGIMHNLGIYGWDLRDALARTATKCAEDIEEPKDNLVMQIVENANERAALRVLSSAKDAAGRQLSPVDAAAQLGANGGIETLVVVLGANNALGAVTALRVAWSGDDYADLDAKKAYTVWNPKHFAAELALVVKQVEKIQARHVIWGTVPHVTIAPVARGVARKARPGSRYFPFYTRPWISDEDFDAKDDPNITEQEARAIDSAIDQYNLAIVGAVKAARQKGLDWHLLEVAGILDRLAARRYIADPAARPAWWTPYELPAELQLLQPVPDSRFFASGPEGRTQGGLFSLDGVHPTTIAYGLFAQEVINVMQGAGVPFLLGDGRTPRTGPVRVDFTRLIANDTLISDPPRSISSDLALIGWLDDKLDIFRRILRLGV